MNREIRFLEKLRELKAEVSNQHKIMTDDELCVYFEQADLSPAQLLMIRDYIAEDDKNEDELSDEDRAYLEECEELYALLPKLNTSDLSLYQKVIDGNRDAYESLAAQYMPKVLDVARAHKTEGILLEELVSEGLIGLTEGLTMIADAKTAHEEIMNAVRKSIRLFLMEQDAEAARDNSIIDKVRRMDEALNVLKEDLGRKVYIEEVADYMNITEEEVWDILKLTGEEVSEDDEEEK